MILDSILNSLFEKHMEIWRRKHGVMFEEGFSVSKVTIGKNTYVSHMASMNPFKGSPIVIGDNCTVKEFCVFRGNLVIGNNVRIACHTIIITTRNNYKDKDTPI